MGEREVSKRNGKEALAMVSKGINDQRNLGASHILPFEYIFMDCQMPEMDGCEATRLIPLKEREYGVHIPVIGLIAHAEGKELNNFLEVIEKYSDQMKILAQNLLGLISKSLGLSSSFIDDYSRNEALPFSDGHR
ncbi:hypothetical protein L1887_42922 [Cichorium endivia]|nr:hypothetical protein L1887_42922 [Cichorium endivia]